MIRNGLISFVLFIVLDLAWFGIVTKNIYLEEFKSFGRIVDGQFQIVYWAAAMVYLLLAIGVSYLILPRFTEDAPLLSVFLTGALFGLITYGVYDMTNLATVKDFSVRIAMIDMGWGTFVCGTVTALTYWISGFFK